VPKAASTGSSRRWKARAAERQGDRAFTPPPGAITHCYRSQTPAAHDLYLGGLSLKRKMSRSQAGEGESRRAGTAQEGRGRSLCANPTARPDRGYGVTSALALAVEAAEALHVPLRL
jgi:hypothetical protein